MNDHPPTRNSKYNSIHKLSSNTNEIRSAFNYSNFKKLDDKENKSFQFNCDL